ncbi:MAG: hypothetical protein ACLQNE_03925 [Thermoguttaceae bacterium]
MGDSEIEKWAGLGATGLFASAGAALQGMRLRIDKQVVVSVDDLYALLHEARRLFEERRFREASARFDHVYRDFGRRIGQWEKAAEARLEALRQSHKPGKLQQLKIEIADVKRQSQGAFRLLSTLRGALDVMRAEDRAE